MTEKTGRVTLNESPCPVCGRPVTDVRDGVATCGRDACHAQATQTVVKEASRTQPARA